MSAETKGELLGSLMSTLVGSSFLLINRVEVHSGDRFREVVQLDPVILNVSHIIEFREQEVDTGRESLRLLKVSHNGSWYFFQVWKVV